MGDGNGHTKYGSLPSASSSTAATSGIQPPPRGAFRPSRTALTAALVTVIGLGSANALLYKTMFEAYGERQAFFVSTGVNFLYIVYGGAILYPRMLFTDKITPEMTRLPKTRFLTMGFLDCLGTFAAAMGAYYTPGQVQTLLNQTLIPITMLASAVYLRTRFSPVQLLGAGLVLLGALAVVLPSFLGSAGAHASPSRWYANLIYFASNIPVACSQVYKEKSFKADRVDVIYLTQWVSIFQFAFGLLLAPLQRLPGVGSAHGIGLAEVAANFADGWRCFLEEDRRCEERGTFFLLLGYCAVNVVFNTAGLFVSKHGSAALNVITYAVLLPITTLLFSAKPIMGRYMEPLRATTVAGLAVVIVGFYLYQNPLLAREERMQLKKRARARGRDKVLAPQPSSSPPKQAALAHEEKEEEEEAEATPMGVQVPSFQERVVAGLGPAIVQVSSSSSSMRTPLRQHQQQQEEEEQAVEVI